MAVKLVKVVGKNVGLNPVARAVALDLMKSKCRTLLILAYDFKQGEVRGEEVFVLASMLSLVMHTMERLGKVDNPEYNVMRGALSSLVAMSSNGYKWHAADTPSIHTGVTRALEVYPSLPAREVQKTWVSLQR